MKNQFMTRIVGAFLALVPAALVAAPTTQEENVLRKMHLINQTEIKLGKMAQSQGQSQAVRDYGKRLVEDHTAADKKVLDTAKRDGYIATNPIRGVDEPAQAQEDQIIKNIKARPANEFDHVFAQELDNAHQDAIASLKTRRDELRGTRAASLINELLPSFQRHEALADALAKKTE